jgi:hypothetical protein
MNDLGPEARSLLEAARGADAPTRADRARIKHAVALRVATVGAASMAAGGAVAMTLATKVTVAALTVAVLGGGSASLWAWKAHTAAPPAVLHPTAPRRSASRTPPARPNPPVAAPEAPAVVEEPRPKPQPPEVRRREAVRGETRPAETARAPVVPSAPAPRPALDSLDPELTVLRQAQEDSARRASGPGAAPAGRIRSPLRQGNPERRKASHRGHSPLSGAPWLRGPGPGRALSARRASVAPGWTGAFRMPEIRRDRKTVQRNCARPGTVEP